MKPKQLADKWFSVYIRLRDADDDGLCHCITCGRIKSPRYMDCGHFIKRQYLGVRYNEMNCHAQCKHCNAFEQGRDAIYEKEILRRYGQKNLDLLKAAKRQIVRMTTFDYTLIADAYKTLAEDLSKKKKIPLW